MDAVERCWMHLCARSGPDSARAIWAEVATAYSAPGRHYHTLQHIAALLTLRREHAALFRSPETADLAILLHDLVYDPSCHDNEAASAAWARARLPALGVTADVCERVAHLIEISRHDAASLAAIDPAGDVAYFLDLDLSVLAADAPIYRDYASAIRQEYLIYPDSLYRPGRRKVLQSFLQRPAIYVSRHFQDLWEVRARRNIEAEIALLA